MTHLLVVGQNPSYSALNNQTLQRLARWMDKAGIRHWSFINVQSKPGTFIPSTEDRHFLWKCLKDTDQPVIAMGRNASMVLERLQVCHQRIQHPSGLNRELNDPDVEEMQALIISEVYNRVNT